MSWLLFDSFELEVQGAVEGLLEGTTATIAGTLEVQGMLDALLGGSTAAAQGIAASLVPPKRPRRTRGILRRAL